jgi:hypothetical protein
MNLYKVAVNEPNLQQLIFNYGSVSGLKTQEYGRRNPSRWPHDTLSLEKLALTSLTSSGISVGIVRSQIEATELDFLFYGPVYEHPHTKVSICKPSRRRVENVGVFS